MPRQSFEHELLRARIAYHLEPTQADYWEGYMRGLRRAFHGKNFGTPREHELWLSHIHDTDKCRYDKGRGYRDGLVWSNKLIRGPWRASLLPG